MKNLLILDAGQYGMVAKEAAQATGDYDKIDFLDDNSDIAIEKAADLQNFYPEYDSVIVAIGNPQVRVKLLQDISETDFAAATLIHPRSYVSPSAKIEKGCIIEPFAVAYTDAVIEDGCFISCGAVVNHNCVVGAYSHIDCNATVMKASVVPSMTNVEANTSYRKQG